MSDELRDELALQTAKQINVEAIFNVMGGAPEFEISKTFSTTIAQKIITITLDKYVEILRNERDSLYDKIIDLKAHLEAEGGNYWGWQGDGEDHLESLVCPVVIRPQELLKIIEERDGLEVRLNKMIEEK